jgi:putative membrane protein
MTDYPIVNALIFSALGVAVFVAAMAIVSKLAPFSLWKQIVEERNVAVAIFAAGVALAMGWIIAATMH